MTSAQGPPAGQAFKATLDPWVSSAGHTGDPAFVYTAGAEGACFRPPISCGRPAQHLSATSALQTQPRPL